MFTNTSAPSNLSAVLQESCKTDVEDNLMAWCSWQNIFPESDMKYSAGMKFNLPAGEKYIVSADLRTGSRGFQTSSYSFLILSPE